MSMSNASSTGTYTPGYAWPKRFMIVMGLIFLSLGAWQLRVPFWLLVFGTRTTAEVVDVVKTKPGLPDIVLHNSAQLEAGLETRDRSYIFWDDFQFTTADGRSITARADVGSQLKPLYPLLDADGLPSNDTVWYDSSHPETVVFPHIISTWFAPAALMIVGFFATLIGSFLLYWSDKPIELPHLPTGSTSTKTTEEKREPNP